MHNCPRDGTENIAFVWVLVSETQVRKHSRLVLLDSITIHRLFCGGNGEFEPYVLVHLFDLRELVGMSQFEGGCPYKLVGFKT